MCFKKTALAIALFLSVFCVNSYSQQPKLKWLADAKSYLNGGYISVQDIEEDTDSSIVVVGYFERDVDFDPGPDTFNLTTISDYDIFIAKYTDKGKLVYAYSFGGLANTLTESAYAVAIDKQGNSYITGTFGKTIDFDPGPGKVLLSAPTSNEIFIVSFTPEGKLRYAKNIADSKSKNAFQSGKSIAVDDEQNIYVTGNFAGKNVDFDPGAEEALFSAQGPLNMFFARYDKFGKYVYAKVIEGSGKDDVKKILLDHEKNILICGALSSYNADFDTGSDTAILETNGVISIFYSKYTNNGNYLFAHAISGDYYASANAMAVATDNSFVLAGVFRGKNTDFDPGEETHLLSSVYNNDVFFGRYDADGNYMYAYSLGTRSSDNCYDITINKKNNFAIIGYLPSYQDVDFDPSPDSSFVLPEIGYHFFAEYTLNGKFLTASSIANFLTTPSCLSVDKKNNFTFAGISYGRLDTALLNDSLYEERSGGQPISLFVAKANEKMHIIDSFTTDGYNIYTTPQTYIHSTTVDKYGNVYTCGGFVGKFDFDPGPGAFYLESLDQYRISSFFAKYDKDGKLIFAKSLLRMYISDMMIDTAQNIYFTGNATNKTDFDPGPGEYHINYKTVQYNIYGYFIAKYFKTGDLVYAKGKVYEEGTGGNEFRSITLDKNNNIYITGTFSTKLDFNTEKGEYFVRSTGGYDMFLAKYNNNGNLLYVNHVGGKGGSCHGYDLKVNSLGDVIITGNMDQSSFDFDPGPGEHILTPATNITYAGYIASYSAKGQLNYAFALQDEEKHSEVQAFTLVTDSSDNVYTCGYFNGKVDFDPGSELLNLSGGEIFFASYNKDGAFRFAKCLQGPRGHTFYLDRISSITTDDKKNLYIAGNFLDSIIDLEPGPGKALLENETVDLRTHSELFLAKYDSLGNFMAKMGFNADSAAGENTSTDIIVSNKNEIIFTGMVKSKIDFDPSQNTQYLTPTAKAGNLFIAKYTLTDVLLRESIPIAVSLNKPGWPHTTETNLH